MFEISIQKTYLYNYQLIFLNKLRGIVYFASSFLIGLVFVVVSLNSFNNVSISNLRTCQLFSEDEPEQNYEIANHQTGFDKEHTAHFNVSGRFFTYRIKGRHRQLRYDIFPSSRHTTTFSNNQKASTLNPDVFAHSFFSDGFQLRGPPSVIII